MLHPEPEAPVDSAPTKPGLPSARGNRRWLGLSVTTLLLLSVAIAVYLFSYVAARRTDLSSRALRTLLVVGEDFSAQLSQMGPILRQVHEKVACPIGGQAAGDDAHPDSLLRETIRLIPNLRADKQEGFERPSSPDTFSGAALQIDVANGATLRFAYFPSDGDSAPCPVSRGAADDRGFQALYAAADFSSLLQAHDLEREFDEVFVAADDGTVLHRERLREGLGGFALTDLRGVANLADDPIDSDSLGGASRTFQVELAGEAYVLYLHPMRPPLPTHLKTPHSDSVKAVDELLIGGLVNRGWLQARSRELPHKVMIALLAVLLVGVLSAPFLKLWYLGGRERFAAFDVLLLGASSLVTAALLTFLVIDVLEYSHLKKELDREAESLADDLLSNLDAEVALAARELRQFFRVVDLDASGETPDATEILKGFSEVSFATYPFMEMIFWADSTGWQQQKWTVRAQATPRVNISDRYYFRAANSGQMRPASLGGGAGSNDTSGFAFEFIQSRTTGESLAVISIALDSIRHPTGTVGAMVISPLSLAAPVLPVGFGFSIIDEAGEIVSSTETRRKENLLVECGNDRLLRSALFTRRSESLTLRCRGARDRIHIRPMGYHRYALVVHRDMAILGTINFEIAISAILFFCLPVVLALIVVSSVLTVLRRHPAWLWPDDHRIPNYFQAMVIVLAFGGWLIIAAPSYPAPVRLLMVLGIPLAILLLVALTLHIQIGAKAPATDGSAANTARRLLVVYRQYIPSASAAVTALLLGMASGDVGAALVVGAIATLAASPPATGWIARRIGGRREPALRAGFVGLGFSLLVALAVGPSLLLFRDAFAHGMESLTRLEQLHLAKTLRAHDESIIDEPRYARAQRCPACPSEPEAPVVLQSQMPNQWSVYRSRVFDDSITRPRKFRAPRTSGPDGLHALVARHFTSLLPAIAPAYSPTVERFRRIGIDRNLKNR